MEKRLAPYPRRCRPYLCKYCVRPVDCLVNLELLIVRINRSLISLPWLSLMVFVSSRKSPRSTLASAFIVALKVSHGV
jgi:hypothetical protein